MNLKHAFTTAVCLVLLTVASCSVPNPAPGVELAASSTTPLPTKMASTATPTPDPEANQSQELASATPTATPPESSTDCSNQAGFVADLSVPDSTIFSPGTPFTKSWRLENTGSCIWTHNYGLVFASGDRMAAHADLPMPGVVAPGQMVDLLVEMTAPEQPGTYQGNWLLRDGGGSTFGLAPDGEAPFWVSIRVLTGRATPVADSPAAGICAEAEGHVVTMTINPDIPDPRCVSVRSNQRLQVVNHREETLTISLGRSSVQLDAGETYTFEATFGELLLPGVHALGVSPCCGGEILLPPDA